MPVSDILQLWTCLDLVYDEIWANINSIFSSGAYYENWYSSYEPALLHGNTVNCQCLNCLYIVLIDS